MSLTLRIDNHDSLPGGGPTSVVVTQAGVQVGRSTAMDWTLPDPDRHISSHHFDVKFENGAYYLVDTSTNGMFLDGSRHRLSAPHALQHGQRFQVGHYYITVEMAAAAAPGLSLPPAAAPVTDTSFAADADPWAIGGGPATPINPNPTPQRNPFDDFAGEFLVNPTAGAAPAAASAPPTAPVTPAASAVSSASPFGAPAAAPQPMGMPPAAPPPGMAQPVPSFSPPPMPPVSPTPMAAAAPGLQQPPVSVTQAPTGDPARFLAAFCEGAGLPPEYAQGVQAIHQGWRPHDDGGH